MTTTFAIVLSLALGLSFILLLLLIGYFRKRKEDQMLQAAFNDAVASANLSLTKVETLGNGILGLDSVHHKLIYCEATGDTYPSYLIDLSAIRNCTVIREYGWVNGTVPYRRSAALFVSRILLQLEYKNNGRHLVIPFYDERHLSPFERRPFAEKAKEWQRLLTALLEKREARSNGVKKQGQDRVPIRA